MRVFVTSPDSRAFQFLKVIPFASEEPTFEYLINETSSSTIVFSKVTLLKFTVPPLLLIKMRLSVLLILLFIKDKFSIVTVP